MVFVTFDWSAFKAYAENCHVGTIQTKQTVEGVEIRVLTGRFGFKAQFKMKDDGFYEKQEVLDEINSFCELHGFIPVEGSVSDEQFHI